MEVAAAVGVLAFQTNDEFCCFGDERNHLNSASPNYSVEIIFFYAIPSITYHLV